MAAQTESDGDPYAEAVRGKRVRRVIAGVVVIVAIGAAWSIVPWSTDPSRSDRIVSVYAKQMGATGKDVATIRQEALASAALICSLDPDELVAEFASSGLDDAIDLAEAACPRSVDRFREAAQRAMEVAEDEDQSTAPAALADGEYVGVVVTETPHQSTVWNVICGRSSTGEPVQAGYFDLPISAESIEDFVGEAPGGHVVEVPLAEWSRGTGSGS